MVHWEPFETLGGPWGPLGPENSPKNSSNQQFFSPCALEGLAGPPSYIN